MQIKVGRAAAVIAVAAGALSATAGTASAIDEGGAHRCAPNNRYVEALYANRFTTCGLARRVEPDALRYSRFNGPGGSWHCHLSPYRGDGYAILSCISPGARDYAITMALYGD